MITTYKTIKSPTEALFKDKGSRFLAYAYPVADLDKVKEYLQALYELHPKAVHHCYAYRLDADGQQVRANDDGEPSGSAGRPILGQIDSLELTHVLVVVVRYFGGVLLGVPGLINAYKTATQLALQEAEIVEKIITRTAHLNCSYEALGEILNIIKNCQGEIVQTDMGIDCFIKFSLPLDSIDTFKSKMEKFYSIDYQFE